MSSRQRAAEHGNLSAPERGVSTPFSLTLKISREVSPSLSSPVNVGSFYVGLISKTVPNELDRAVFSINGAMLSIDNEKRFPLDPTTEPDGIGNRDWRNLYRSLVTEGPAVISIPCRV